MNIFKQIQKSIFGPDYYKSNVLAQPFTASFKYLIKVILLASLVGIIVFAFGVPTFYTTVKKMVNTEIANFPDDLTISIKNGVASVNKPEPYSLKFANKIEEKDDAKTPDNILVVDTTKDFSLNTFAAYNTVALMTKTDLVMPKDDKGSLQTVPLSKFGNAEINKSFLSEIESKLIKFFPVIILFVMIFMYIGLFLGFFISTMFMLLIYSFAIWLLAKVKGDKEFNYKSAYKVGMHATTILIIFTLLSVFVPVLSKFLIRLVGILIITYINLYPAGQPEIKVEVQA